MAVVTSLLGAVIVQELAGASPGHLHSVWRSSVADTLVWGAHEVRSGQPSRFSPLGFQHSLFPRHGLARGAHAGSAQCMAMLEPWPTVSFLSHPPARKRFPLIRPGKLSGVQALHYFASISLMTSKFTIVMNIVLRHILKYWPQPRPPSSAALCLALCVSGAASPANGVVFSQPLSENATVGVLGRAGGILRTPAYPPRIGVGVLGGHRMSPDTRAAGRPQHAPL